MMKQAFDHTILSLLMANRGENEDSDNHRGNRGPPIMRNPAQEGLFLHSNDHVVSLSGITASDNSEEEEDINDLLGLQIMINRATRELLESRPALDDDDENSLSESSFNEHPNDEAVLEDDSWRTSDESSCASYAADSVKLAFRRGVHRRRPKRRSSGRATSREPREDAFTVDSIELARTRNLTPRTKAVDVRDSLELVLSPAPMPRQVVKNEEDVLKKLSDSPGVVAAPDVDTMKPVRISNSAA